MNPFARDVERAADAVRTANHSTMRGPLSPQEVYDAVGRLDDLARRLPQVLGFLSRSLGHAEPAEHRDDRGGDPAVTLTGAQAGLVDATDDAERLAHHSTHAHIHLGRLARLIPED